MKKIIIVGITLVCISFSNSLPAAAQEEQESTGLTQNSQQQSFTDFEKIQQHIEIIKELPHDAEIVGSGNTYSYYNGIFYQPTETGYKIVSPPVGIRVSELPKENFRITLKKSIYYYFNGVFYSRDIDGAYRVMTAPMGVLVDELPLGCYLIDIEGSQYFALNNVYYKKVTTPESKIRFKVVGQALSKK